MIFSSVRSQFKLHPCVQKDWIPFHVHDTCIGLYWVSVANLHLDFQYEILPQSSEVSAFGIFMLQMSYYNQKTCHTTTYAFLHPLNGTDPGQALGGTTGKLLSLGELTMTIRPRAIWSHFETGPALRKTVSTGPQQQLSNALKELQKTRDTQLLLNKSQA